MLSSHKLALSRERDWVRGKQLEVFDSMSDSVLDASVSTASEAGTCERRVIDLLGHLLVLASDIAPDSRSLGTEEFRAQLELYRTQLSQAAN